MEIPIPIPIPIPLMQLILALVAGTVIPGRAYRKKSLDLSGAFAGFLVTTIHIALSYRLGAMLLVFFFTSSKFTKYGEEKKRKLEAEFKEGGQRNWVQVVCNSCIATILMLIGWKINGSQDKCLDSKESALLTSLVGGIIGHYSCSNGDTWSSELGILSHEHPVLITTLKTVKHGTNGGVTKTGLLAATAGGGVIGLTFVVVGLFTATCNTNTAALKQFLVIPISAMAGLLGSLIDSLLGATLQFSGFCNIRNKVVYKPGHSVKKISGLSILDNNAVNFFSVLMTTVLTAVACLYIF